MRLLHLLEGLKNGVDLKARAARGGLWLGGGNGVEQLLRFVRNMILTRMLMPEALGLMAIISAFNAALKSFTEIGVSEAVVQNPAGAEETFLNSAWFLLFFRSLGLTILGVALAPFVFDFYHMTTTPLILQISLLSILFEGTGSVKAFVALKKMNYRKWVLIHQGGGIIGVLTTLVLAYVLKNEWALMFGFVAESAMRCLLSYILCPFTPRLKFNREHTRALFAFSKGFFGLPILYFIFIQADIFIVAKVCTKSDLGLYSMASSVAHAPALLVSVFIQPLMMPSLSEMRAQTDRINHTLLQVTGLLCLVCFPILAFTAVYAGDILTLIYGSLYEAGAASLILMLSATILRTCSAPISTAYLAAGKPGLQRRFLLIRAGLMIVLTYPLTLKLGMAGAALSGLIAMTVSYGFQIFELRRLSGLNLTRYTGILLKALVFSLPVLVVGGLLPRTPMSPFFSLLMALGICLAAYALLFGAAYRFLDPKRLLSV